MIQYSFEFVDMVDEIIAVPVGNGASTVGGVLKLNQQGRELFELLQYGTEEQAVEILKKKYDNPYEELRDYVYSFVASLKESGIWKD